MISPSHAAMLGFVGGAIFIGGYGYIYTRAAYWQAVHRIRIFIINNMTSFGDKNNDIDTGYWIMLASLSQFLLSDLAANDPKFSDIIRWSIPNFDPCVLPTIVTEIEQNYLSCFDSSYIQEMKKEATNNTSILVDSGTRLHS